MSPPEGSSTLSLNDGDADEDRVRMALGLAPRGRAPRPPEQMRQRPARDEGAVPVVSLRRPEQADGARLRIAALEGELKAERAERAAAQHALSEAQRMIQQLQTKLAHGEIAAAEALKTEQDARQAAEARLAAAQLAIPAAIAVPAKRRGRPPGVSPAVETPEPEPVQWWLPSYAASKAKRGRSRS